MRLEALLLATFALLGPPAPARATATPAAPILTIVDGEAQVIRESVRFAAVEGLRLEAEDIVHTADGARLLRIEFGDGSAIDLGAATRVQWQPRLAVETGPDRPGRLYAMSGWVKLSGAGAAFTSARLDASELSGAVVARIAEGAAFVFVESGTLRLLERSASRPPQTHALKEGEAYQRQGEEPGTASARPGAALLASVPRAFADSLPLRARRFHDKAVATPAATDIAYADVAAWINGERALRHGFVQRWRGKLRDPQFRSAVAAELAAHPEWDRSLNPEKYAPPRPRPVAARAAGSAASAPAATQVAGSARSALFAPELLPLTSAMSPDRSPRTPAWPRLP